MRGCCSLPKSSEPNQLCAGARRFPLPCLTLKMLCSHLIRSAARAERPRRATVRHWCAEVYMTCTNLDCCTGRLVAQRAKRRQ